MATAKKQKTGDKVVAKVLVTQTRSTIGRDINFKRIVSAVGLGRIGDKVELPVNKSILGSLKKITHIVTIQELSK